MDLAMGLSDLFKKKKKKWSDGLDFTGTDLRQLSSSTSAIMLAHMGVIASVLISKSCCAG